MRNAISRAALAVTVLLLASTGGTAAAAESCATRLLKVWPEPGSELSTGARIVLEGYGELRDGVADVVKRRPTLRSRDEQVELTVVATYLTSRRVATVVLAPRSELKPGTSYELAFGVHVKKGSDDVLEQVQTLAWKTASGRAPEPSWIAPPWVVGLEPAGTEKERGRVARIAVDVAAPREWQVLAEVQGDGPPQRYLVEIRRNEARLGGDPCSDVFAFRPSKRYHVTLSAIDSAGNIVPAKGKPIVIGGS